MRAVASLSLAFLLAAPGLTHAQTITSALPAGVRPGQTVDVTFFGDNLQGSSALWASFPVKATLAPGVDKNGTLKDRVVFRLEVPAEVPAGVEGVRVVTDKGISAPLLILVDDLPADKDNGANKAIAQAQPLTAPIAIDGTCEAESYDYYKIVGKAGERISVEVVAARLGTALDPVIRLLDATGQRELAYSDDEPGIAPDCRLAYKFPTDGEYLLEVRDIRYQGGGGHRYRLRAGNFPLVTTPYPLGGKKGTDVTVSFVGPDAAQAQPLTFKTPTEPLTERMWIGAKLPGGVGAVFVPFALGDSPEIVETEPNDKPEQSTTVALPAGINGRLEQPKDRDCYQFEGKKGERWLFRGITRTLGSPSDLFLRLLKADGGQLAEAEDSGTAEGVLNFPIPADGVYRLVVEDLHRRGGPQHAYRIEVEAYQPGFSLALTHPEKKEQFIETLNAPRGGVFRARVVIGRRDYDGPIELSVEGAGDVKLSGEKIEAKKNETILTVTIPETMEPGQPRAIAILGKAKIGEREVVERASVRDSLVKLFNNQPYPPPQLARVIGLGVGPVFPEFFSLSSPGPGTYPQLVGVGSFKVAAKRMNKFEDPISLIIEGLPEGVKAEVKPIEKGKGDVEIKLTGKADLPEGEFKLKIVGNGTFQGQPKWAVVPELIVKVVKPLAVTAAAVGPLLSGQKQKVKVTLTRYGERKDPVALTLKNLPAGVTAPEGLAIAADRNELEFELSATADAAPAKIENLQVAAATKINGQDVAAESPAFVLEVKKP